MKVKQAQLAKAKAEPDINPNLIAVGNRVITKQKPKEEEIPDIEWWYASFILLISFGLYQTTLWPTGH
jgi:U4/U6 small nuclear ribonucleoprotein PRP3